MVVPPAESMAVAGALFLLLAVGRPVLVPAFPPLGSAFVSMQAVL